VGIDSGKRSARMKSFAVEEYNICNRPRSGKSFFARNQQAAIAIAGKL
jgi:hypothetical protein